jgi:prepilin peptidase CpaA
MVAATLLIALVLVAAVTDLRRHTIYNWTTYPGMLAALALNGLGDLLVRTGLAGAAGCQRWGWLGFAQSVFGLLLCGGIVLACFVFFRDVGGGDVKLIAMMGAFLGPDRGIEAMLWTFVLAACLAVVVLVWRVGPLRLLLAMGRQALWTLRLGRVNPIDPQVRAQLQPPLFLAPSALAAVLIVQFSLVEYF